MFKYFLLCVVMALGCSPASHRPCKRPEYGGQAMRGHPMRLGQNARRGEPVGRE